MEPKCAKTDEISTAIDPVVMSRYYDVTPDKSRYYVAYDDEEEISYAVCFGSTELLRTLYGDQLVSVDEIDRIELIDAETFDD